MRTERKNRGDPELTKIITVFAVIGIILSLFGLTALTVSLKVSADETSPVSFEGITKAKYYSSLPPDPTVVIHGEPIKEVTVTIHKGDALVSEQTFTHDPGSDTWSSGEIHRLPMDFTSVKSSGKYTVEVRGAIKDETVTTTDNTGENSDPGDENSGTGEEGSEAGDESSDPESSGPEDSGDGHTEEESEPDSSSDPISEKEFKDLIYFFYDSEDPQIIIDGPNNETITSMDQTVKVTFSDDLKLDPENCRVTMVRNGGKEQDITKKAVSGMTISAEGFYQIHAVAADKSGRKNEETISFRIDKSAPVVSITGVTEGKITNQDVSFFCSAEDDSLDYDFTTVRIYHDGKEKNITNDALNKIYSVSDEGKYRVVLEAVDKAGHKTEVIRTFIIDKTDPRIEIVGIGDGDITNKDVNPEVRASDENGLDENRCKITLEYTSGNGETSSVDITKSTLNSSCLLEKEGDYKIIVAVYDKAGNMSTRTIQFKIDKSAPNLSLSGMINGKYVKQLSQLKAEAGKGNNPTRSRLTKLNLTFEKSGQEIHHARGRKVSPSQSYASLSQEKEGDYKTDQEIWLVTASAYDKAGNEAVIKREIIKDNMDPRIGFKGAEKTKFYNSTRDFSADITESNPDKSEMLVMLNGKELEGTRTSRQLTQPGKYAIFVKATDLAGNSNSEKTRFILDFKTPDVTLTGPANKSHNRNPIAATARSSEPGTIFMEVVHDGTVIYSGKSKPNDRSAPSLSFKRWDKDGNYEVTAYAKDRAGNAGQKKKLSFVRDRVAPKVFVTGVKKGEITNKTQSVSVRASERYYKTAKVRVSVTRRFKGTSSKIPFQFSLSGKDSQKNLPVSKSGVYTVSLSGTDKAGNKSDGKTLSFEIDKEAPAVSISVNAENGYAERVRPVIRIKDRNMKTKNVVMVKKEGAGAGKRGFDFDDDATNTGVKRIYAEFSKNRKDDGIYQITAKARDKAGNERERVKRFTVNRYGSRFKILSAPKKYQKKVKSFVEVSEHNFSAIREYTVQMQRDSETSNINNRTIQTSHHGSVHRYNINPENFYDEGIYRLNLKTRDAAGNKSETRKQKNCNMWFAVDRTPPTVSATGVKDHTLYRLLSKKVYVEATDTISKKVNITASVNKKPREIRKDSKGRYVLVGKGYNQKIQIFAKDDAGNVGINEIKGVSVSNNPFAGVLSKTRLLIGLGIFAAGVGIGLMVLFLRRKQDPETADDLEF